MPGMAAGPRRQRRRGRRCRRSCRPDTAPPTYYAAQRSKKPVIGDDEVLIRVQAAGLDRGTWHLMTGKPYLIRLVSGLRTPKSPVPGLDVAGTVVTTGAAVTR